MKIGRMFERFGRVGGQLNTAPGGAGNTGIRGPRHDHFLGGIVTGDQSTHSSSELHRRNQLALSILSHRRDDTAVDQALAALRGASLAELAMPGPSGDA